MNDTMIKKILKTILLFMSLLYFILPIGPLYAKETPIIKVGYPIVKGFTDKQNDLYTGYVYDYLREIAIYTGWEYEFIEMDLSAAMDALKEGEIDLLAGMIKNEQTTQLFDFPSYDLGSTYTTLSVLEGSSYLNNSRYVVLDNMKVGYYETSTTRLANFMDFCQSNGIQDAQLVPYPHTPDREDLVQKLKDKEVDALIGNDLSLTDDEKVIAKFGAAQHFLATTKGNTELIKELDKALSRIKSRNPDFEDTLYAKYFEHNYYHTLILSKEQSDYLGSLPPIKAVYIRNYIPIQYYDEQTQQAKGILIDTARLLATRLGISFEFIPVETYEDAYQMIEDQTADIIVGVADDYLIADQHNFILTAHYLKLQLTKAINTNHPVEEGPEIIALPIGHEHFNLGDLSSNYEIHYYDTLEECLEAVNKGTAHATYSNAYSVSNYLAHESYNNIVMFPNTQEIGIAVGLSKALDPHLVDIFHKAIYYLPKDRLDEIVANNTLDIQYPFNFKLFFYENMALCLWMLGIILSLIGASIAIYIRLLFNKTQLDSLTGICNREACERLVAKYSRSKKLSSYSAFIIIDIDHFKQINDRFGHKIGDNLLVEFSHALRKNFPKRTIISRLGGDEFIIFMKDIDECAIHTVGEKLNQLCHTMHKEIEHKGCYQEISLSIGAIVTNQALSFNQLYTTADELLYEVKRSGRNNFKVRLF